MDHATVAVVCAKRDVARVCRTQLLSPKHSANYRQATSVRHVTNASQCNRQQEEQIARSRVVHSCQDILTCGGPYLIAPGEAEMGFLKDGLLWLAGVSLPFILLLALFMHPG